MAGKRKIKKPPANYRGPIIISIPDFPLRGPSALKAYAFYPGGVISSCLSSFNLFVFRFTH